MHYALSMQVTYTPGPATAKTRPLAGATDRQRNVLERLQRDLAQLPYSPSPALKDLYRDIGPEGLAEAKRIVEEAYKHAGEASGIIGLYLDHSLTRTIMTMLDKPCVGVPCGYAICPKCKQE